MHGNGEKPVGSEAADPALAATDRPTSALPEPEPAAAFGPTVPAADGTLNVTATDAATPRARARLTGLAGRRLAHYRIEEEIGRGGMGVVYLARDLALDRPVAIKVLSGEFTTPSEERFYREARVADRLGIDRRDLYPHRFRHTYVHFFLGELRGDPEALVKVQQQMGWARMETAGSYMRRARQAELDEVEFRLLSGRKKSH